MKNKILVGLSVVVCCIALAYAAATTFDNVRVKGTLQVDGITTFNGSPKVPVINILTSTPTAAGLLAQTTNYVLYISTAANGTTNWIKVGAQ